MNIEWWINLDTDNKRLLAGLFVVISVLSSIVGYQYVEKNNIEKAHKLELLEERKSTIVERKEKEAAQLSLRNSEIDCTKRELQAVRELLDEQKKKNSEFEKVTKQQGEIILTNRNFVDGTTKIVKEITKTIEPSNQ